jgi:2-dehydro-3-deoxyphosphogluconate aldolase/(4S)-4-hydroxy-2-oxoglutarate aldolase
MGTVEKIEKQKLVVVIRTDTPDEALEAALACIKGGVRLVEITFSVPEAEGVIERLVDIEGVTVGAGTVLDIADAEKALRAGASYVVSPHLDEEIVRFTKSGGAVSVPGASTPTEILKAHRAGGDIIKLFPFVEMGGLKFLKTIRGPLPFIKYMPSGGVTLDNVTEYLAAGVSGIIVGSSIIKREFVKTGDWGAITELSRSFVDRIPVNKSILEDRQHVSP